MRWGAVFRALNDNDVDDDDGGDYGYFEGGGKDRAGVLYGDVAVIAVSMDELLE